MGQSQEPQRIPEEREFLHELSNPLTTALALAAKIQKIQDVGEIHSTCERLAKALEQSVDLVKTRRRAMKETEN